MTQNSSVWIQNRHQTLSERETRFSRNWWKESWWLKVTHLFPSLEHTQNQRWRFLADQAQFSMIGYTRYITWKKQKQILFSWIVLGTFWKFNRWTSTPKQDSEFESGTLRFHTLSKSPLGSTNLWLSVWQCQATSSHFKFNEFSRGQWTRSVVLSGVRLNVQSFWGPSLIEVCPKFEFQIQLNSIQRWESDVKHFD